jgi:adenylate cyclase
LEKNIAILIADLSGYTALTETHGAGVAADLIDNYLEMVKSSLNGDCELHQRVGDEILVVSSSPDCILATAVLLLRNAMDRHLFLQLHGGLHYGEILQRNGSYFGTTINKTARIAASAPAGSFYCSGDFVSALKGQHSIHFEPKGDFNFKNLSGSTSVYAINSGNIESCHIDPVCKMLIRKDAGALKHPDKDDIYFCSETCRETYLHSMGQAP